MLDPSGAVGFDKLDEVEEHQHAEAPPRCILHLSSLQRKDVNVAVIRHEPVAGMLGGGKIEPLFR